METFEIFTVIIHTVIALGLINVWLVRSNEKTNYRGKNAKNMVDEFKAYGLPSWFTYAIGSLKIAIAGLLMTALWVPIVTLPSAGALALLMIGALMMHAKVRDNALRYIPAMTMLLLSLLAIMIHLQ